MKIEPSDVLGDLLTLASMLIGIVAAVLLVAVIIHAMLYGCPPQQ
jgi:hypothetical protein